MLASLLIGASLLAAEGHLLIGDPRAALHLLDPQTHPQLTLTALAESGDFYALRRRWQELSPPDTAEWLEPVAWAIIRSGVGEGSLILRHVGQTLGALAQDTLGVELIERGLHDPNRRVRLHAAQLSTRLQDARLKEAVIRRLKEERAPEVRVELIRAAGQLHLESLTTELEEILADPHRSPRERTAALDALVHLRSEATAEHLATLASSHWRGHRLLASRLMVQFEEQADRGLLLSMAGDPDPEVRCNALVALRLLRLEGDFRSYLEDRDTTVRLIAAWAAGDPTSFVAEREGPYAPLAGALLAQGGEALRPLARSWLHTHPDLLTRLTLALHFLEQREEIPTALAVLREALASPHIRFASTSLPGWGALFHHLSAHEPNLSERDQWERLHLLHTLLIFEDPQALSLLKPYLREWEWEHSATALALWLQEGNPAPIRELLNDPERRMRIHAALVLMIVEENEEAVTLLLKEYPSASRLQKLAILEFLGRTPSSAALPFLRDRMLNEPFPSLRLISAGSILERLNH